MSCEPALSVLHVITGLHTGGAETMLARLLPALRQRGVESEVVALMPGGAMRDRLAAAGFAVNDLGLDRGAADPRAVLRLVRLLRARRPAVVQSWLYHADLAATLAAPLAGVRRLAWNLRCSDMRLDHYAPRTRRVLRLLALLSRRPEAIVSNSEAGLAVHRALGYRPRRSQVIPNGLDLDQFRPDPVRRATMRAALGLGHAEPVFVHVGRLDPMKDHPGLLRAFAVVREQLADARLLLAGRGTEALAAAPGVLALGERADVAAVLNAGDVFVLSSAFGEGFPNALAEAMASGLSCVTTDVGDAAAMLAHAGEVVAPSDPGALAAAMARALEAAPARAPAARRHAEQHFALDAIADQYAAFYRRLAV